jgi:hypothetical protein
MTGHRAHAVAIISDGFWRRNFGSDPSVLGRDLQVNNHSYTIIGVAARGFSGTDVGSPTDIWLPMMMQAQVGRNFLTDARTNWLEMIGRLTSDRSAESAGAELTALLQRRAPDLMSVFPDKRITLVSGGKGNSGVRRELDPALRLLLALASSPSSSPVSTWRAFSPCDLPRERKRSRSGWRSAPHGRASRGSF